MKPGRNTPCPCGSGKKYKHCCGKSGGLDTAGASSPAQPPGHPTEAALAKAVETAAAHLRAGQVLQAETLCRRVLQAKPDYPEALQLLGQIALQTGHTAAAGELFGKAASQNPNNASLQYYLGIALRLQGKYRDALVSLDKALRLNPTLPEAHYACGNVHFTLQQPEQAIASYRRALALKPAFTEARYNLIQVQIRICDWSELGTVREVLLEPTLAAGGATRATPPDPSGVIMLPLPVTPAEQQTIARAFVRKKTAGLGSLRQSLGFKHPTGTRTRLRIGYMSSDFRDHPTTHLAQGMFRQHDRERVEVFGYSLGRDDASHYRRQVVEDCDHFRDVSTLSPGETARSIHADGIDILVDLNGHTTGNRFEVLALAPAPIQVSYLGYPGTLGAEFVDYLLTDRIVTPPGMEAFFDEQLVYLPNCYQVNARDAPTAVEIPSRATCGLPENAFVFCCFNNTYKIDPLMFDVWTRILQRVEDSVLWLFSKYEAAVNNLRREAEARGLASERLIFAERVPLAEHLARQHQADLFLDTYYYNAHTTASDGLWAGVPVLTCPGATFASRVCTSLLHAAGLPEMSVTDLTAYENTAVALARDPDRLQRMKQQLAANRATSPLFDARRFVRNLENAYRQMWDAREQGKPRRSIQVREEMGENQNHGR